MIRVTPHIVFDASELQFHFVRSSGPGGQKVNKVSSAVQLRYDAANSPHLPGDVRMRLLTLAGKRANKDGIIVIKAQRFRTQESNCQDALERLLNLIRRAALRPKHRISTRPTRASAQKRVEAKKRRGEIKELRRVPLERGNGY